tara:strand:- start:176 stop:433 length:258 start_codon:yes stop_codon:yes gene_type:complete
MSPKMNVSLTVLYAIFACISLFLSYETHITNQGILPILFGIFFGVLISVIVYQIASTPEEPDISYKEKYSEMNEWFKNNTWEEPK